MSIAHAYMHEFNHWCIHVCAHSCIYVITQPFINSFQPSQLIHACFQQFIPTCVAMALKSSSSIHVFQSFIHSYSSAIKQFMNVYQPTHKLIHAIDNYIQLIPLTSCLNYTYAVVLHSSSYTRHTCVSGSNWFQVM